MTFVGGPQFLQALSQPGHWNLAKNLTQMSELTHQPARVWASWLDAAGLPSTFKMSGSLTRGTSDGQSQLLLSWQFYGLYMLAFMMLPSLLGVTMLV